jgi:anti-anti-sigma factor
MTSSELQEFYIREESEPDRSVRLTLYGELDIATVAELDQRVSQLALRGLGVRVDLSRLRFIDVCGLRAVMRAIELANNEGAWLEIDPKVSRPVRRLIGWVGGEAEIWPEADRIARRRDRPELRRRRRLATHRDRLRREPARRRSTDRLDLRRDG